MRIVDEEKTTTKADVLKRITRRLLSRFGLCDRCPPHRRENARRHPRTDKYKNHRS
jgi:hypothetical protein